jgi:hypothetical protein
MSDFLKIIEELKTKKEEILQLEPGIRKKCEETQEKANKELQEKIREIERPLQVKAEEYKALSKKYLGLAEGDRADIITTAEMIKKVISL